MTEYPNPNFPHSKVVKNLYIAPEFCTKVRHKLSECTKCIDVCPGQALGFDNGLKLNSMACVSCGLCAAVCPTGVFFLAARSAIQLFNEIKKAEIDNEVCSFVCERQIDRIEPNGAVFEVGCLGQVEVLHIVTAAVTNAAGVRLITVGCEDCPLRNGYEIGAFAVDQANKILAAFGFAGFASVEMPRYLQNDDRSHNQKGLSRQEFLKLLVDPGVWVAYNLIDPKKKGKDVLLEGGLVKGPQSTYLPVQRVVLLRLLDFLETNNHPSYESVDESPFAEVSINQNCNGCGMCAYFCPTGAMVKREVDGCKALEFQPALCTNCHLCSDLCSRAAVEMSYQIDLKKILENRHEIFSINPKNQNMLKDTFERFHGKKGVFS